MRVGVILAGGESRRFQGNKLIVEIDGSPVIKRVYNAIKDYVDITYISIKDEDRYEELSSVFHGIDVKYIYDYKELDGGPYVGIITSLDLIEADEFIIVPGDTPWIKGIFFNKWLKYIDECRPIASSVIWGNGMIDSLFLYVEKRRIRSIIKLLYLLRKSGRATDILRAAPYTYLVNAYKVVDSPLWLAHLNTREDLISPSPRNPLKGVVKNDIHIKWNGLSSIPFLNALDKINLGEYTEAVSILLDEARKYNEYNIMHLIDHVAKDICNVVNKMI